MYALVGVVQSTDRRPPKRRGKKTLTWERPKISDKHELGLSAGSLAPLARMSSGEHGVYKTAAVSITFPVQLSPRPLTLHYQTSCQP